MAKMLTPAMEKFNKKNKGSSSLGASGSKYFFWIDAWRRLKRNKTALIGLAVILLLMLIALSAPLIAMYDPTVIDYMSLNKVPSGEHFFGTDHLGRDIFSRCVYAARVSLPMGIATMLSSLVIGGGLGLIAAFFGGRIDSIIMRIMDIFQSIPSTLMAIIIIASLGTGIFQLIIAIAISFMPNMAKTVRAAILTVRGNEYIEACRCLGASNVRLMLRHMLPNAFGFIIIFAVSTISLGIMVIASMSYLGLGIQPPTAEWGSMLSAAKAYISNYPHELIFPGFMIMLAVLGFNMFGDGLRDALDPRLK